MSDNYTFFIQYPNKCLYVQEFNQPNTHKQAVNILVRNPLINRFKDIPESDFAYYAKTCRKLKQKADKLRKLSKEVK